MKLFTGEHKPRLTAIDLLKYIGPGMLITVGFIDPGNWASNIAAGSSYGYRLLWMVTLSTVMLIILQHNAAHLGIVTGKVPFGSGDGEHAPPAEKHHTRYCNDRVGVDRHG